MSTLNSERMSTTEQYLSLVTPFMKTPRATDLQTKPKMHKSLFTERKNEVDAAATGEMPKIDGSKF